VVIGGLGPTRTPALAARYANEYNQPFVPVSFFTEQRDRVHAACEAIDRDPDDLVLSVALVVCCGHNDEAVEMRAGAIGRGSDELRENGLCGHPAQILDKIADYAEAGVNRIYLQVLDLDDLDHVRLLGDEVLKLLP
jgi:alkanesulfonate monooxygenase SsuD/methylene tetrahydromethanopterin reductase-like flavin-dependent oxidoreductase (luciferase family)